MNGTVALTSTARSPSRRPPNFNGADSFTYTVADGNGGTDDRHGDGRRSTAANDAPVAVNDTRATNEDMALAFAAADLLANDTDLDGDDADGDGGRRSR